MQPDRNRAENHQAEGDGNAGQVEQAREDAPRVELCPHLAMPQETQWQGYQHIVERRVGEFRDSDPDRLCLDQHLGIELDVAIESVL